MEEFLINKRERIIAPLWLIFKEYKSNEFEDEFLSKSSTISSINDGLISDESENKYSKLVLSTEDAFSDKISFILFNISSLLFAKSI